MSGILSSMVGAGLGAINAAFSAALAFTGASSGTYTAQASFQSDGTVIYTHGSGDANYFSPTIPGIGSSWWVKAVVSSGSGYTLGGSLADGGWHQISGFQNITVQNSNSNAESTGTFTVSFSPDGGTTTAAAGNMTWDCGKVT